jgi:apolipoprotein N-acyltransferase
MDGPTAKASRKADSIPGSRPLADRWWGKWLLLFIGIVLLSLAFAPFNQFYLAWVGVVPWLVVVRYCRSTLRAFLWSWLGGTLFYIANMWWLAGITLPGMIALMVVLGLYPAAAGAIIFAGRLLDPIACDVNSSAPGRGFVCWKKSLLNVFLIAFVWTASEWFRGTWPLGGLAWLYLGHAQTPALYLCQVADFSGVFGVTFWVMLVNAWLTLFVLYRKPSVRPLAPAGVAVGVVLVAVLGYGIFRFAQFKGRTGPTILVVQSNVPQSNEGDKAGSMQDLVKFHVDQTEAALSHHGHVDLVVWSETMMPALNREAREYLLSLPYPRLQQEALFLADVDRQITELAQKYRTELLVGGAYSADWTSQPTADHMIAFIARDKRNTAYFYTAAGQSAERYDKIHLVPFGEYLPFKETVPSMYKLFVAMSPYKDEHTLTPGAPDAMTVFKLKKDWRFVTPICFEDIVAEVVRQMLKPEDGVHKRADFIVNLTNDGWFLFNEMPQHLQAASFRSIENRVPTARSVNTGISGFVDSMGRTFDLVPPSVEGSSIGTLTLDDRVTAYTLYGDLFAYFCVGVTVLVIVQGIVLGFIGRREKLPPTRA